MGAQVLVVEDDGDLCDAMTVVLRYRGYEVACARSGNEAIAQLQQGAHPCLMLLDLQMADGTGLDVLDAMHADPRLAVETIVVTALHRARVPYGTRMMKKPFHLAEFLGAIDRACRRPAPGSPTPGTTPGRCYAGSNATPEGGCCAGVRAHRGGRC